MFAWAGFDEAAVAPNIVDADVTFRAAIPDYTGGIVEIEDESWFWIAV